MKGKEHLKILKLTKSDRELLKSIDKSLKDVQKGRVKELIVEELKKHR